MAGLVGLGIAPDTFTRDIKRARGDAREQIHNQRAEVGAPGAGLVGVGLARAASALIDHGDQDAVFRFEVVEHRRR